MCFLSLTANLDCIPALESVFFDLNFTPNEFDRFDEFHGLYEGGIKLPTKILSKISSWICVTA